MEGSGFFAAAKRMVLSTIFLMTGRYRHHHVHSSSAEILRTLPAPLRLELHAALRVFRARGLLDEPAVP